MRILDEFIVSLVLLISILYAVLSLGPRSWRGRMAGAAATGLSRLPNFPGLRAATQRLNATAAKGAGACGGCGSCGSEQPTASGAAAAPGPNGEVRISVTTIGRR